MSNLNFFRNFFHSSNFIGYTVDIEKKDGQLVTGRINQITEQFVETFLDPGEDKVFTKTNYEDIENVTPYGKYDPTKGSC